MTKVFVPRESVNDQTVLVQKIHLVSGATAQAGQIVMEIETSKTVLEVEAPETGVIHHVLSTGAEIVVGDLLFTVGEQGQESTPAEAATSTAADFTAQASAGSQTSADAGAMAMPNAEMMPALNAAVSSEPPLLSKAASHLAQQTGQSLQGFEGRWVTVADIQRGRPAEVQAEIQAARQVQAKTPAAIAPQLMDALPLPALPFDEKPNAMRKRAEIENLVKARHAETMSTIGIKVQLPGARIVSPHFLFVDSISDLIIFEGARLLKQYPELNGFHIDGKRSGHFQDVNFGVSFDNHQNLKVLSLQGSEKLSLPALHTAFSDLLDLFESGKPIPAELLGTSTVTLSDLSTTSASFMLPLINGQQSLILGVVKHQPQVFEIFASFDHRVSEGLRVTKFLQELRDRIISHYHDTNGFVKISCSVCSKSMQDELKLGNRGFINLTTPTGELATLCRNCFEGR